MQEAEDRAPGARVATLTQAEGAPAAGAGAATRPGVRVRLLYLMYALTILASALLLFIIEPMFARMALPLLGGSPAVWTTATVFYQVVLLAGYLYAHYVASRLKTGRQFGVHVALLFLPFLVLPLAIPPGWSPPVDRNPIPWLLALMLVRVGLPFLVLSTTSPLFQSWFAGTRHPAARDPYFLYAASNAGSIAGLLLYPLVLEPRLRVGSQTMTWTLGYGGFVLLALLTLGLTWQARPAAAGRVEAGREPDRAADRIATRTRLRWVLLAFVPSTLMLSVTTYIATDVASFPLLWVVPLLLYLLTFVIAFARRQLVPERFLARLAPILLIVLVLTSALPVHLPLWVGLLLNLATFFAVALLCHHLLAAGRPAPRHLTEFYLWLSVGGALGGVFNALLAPLLFQTVAEYWIGLVLAALIAGAANAGGQVRPVWRDLLLPLGLAALMAGLVMLPRYFGSVDAKVVLPLILILPALACLRFSRRPVRFALGVAAILLVGNLYVSTTTNAVLSERSFFGITRVLYDPVRDTRLMMHGTTLHGMQSLDPARRCQPLTYFYPSGPAGQLFGRLNAEARPPQQVAIVGLGAGSLAGYRQPGQEWTFYEIDPVVARIAADPRYFTYLSGCAPDARIVMGDARLSLAKEPPGKYDVLVLDAYSSDSIPVHLITREALALYADKLAPGGVLAFHISNRNLDLEPVVADLVRDAGLAALLQLDGAVSPQEDAEGKSPSMWAVMARDPETLRGLAADPRWRPLAPRPGSRLWTDDYSSVVDLIRWR